jgi:spermidine synthase
MFRLIVLFSTFLSGITGLAYQVYWQRYLSFLVGSEAKSIALVVAIFLLGLASGYEFWGRMTEKIESKHRLLKIYAFIELGIGGFAIIFPYYFEFLKSIVHSSGSNFFLDLIITILSIFLPTFLMGGTVPILTSYMPKTEEEVNDAHSKIYGLNSLGAFSGVFMGAFLIPEFGLTLSITLTGILNLLIGLFFFVNNEEGKVKKQNSIPFIQNKFGDNWVYVLVFVTGMVSLGLEVIMVRALGLAIGMSYIVFPIVLSLFILGLALGSLSLKDSNKLDISFIFKELSKHNFKI